MSTEYYTTPSVAYDDANTKLKAENEELKQRLSALLGERDALCVNRSLTVDERPGYDEIVANNGALTRRVEELLEILRHHADRARARTAPGHPPCMNEPYAHGLQRAYEHAVKLVAELIGGAS